MTSSYYNSISGLKNELNWQIKNEKEKIDPQYYFSHLNRLANERLSAKNRMNDLKETESEKWIRNFLERNKNYHQGMVPEFGGDINHFQINIQKMSQDVLQKIMGGMTDPSNYSKKDVNKLKKKICRIFGLTFVYSSPIETLPSTNAPVSEQSIILFQTSKKNTNTETKKNKSKKNKTRRNTGQRAVMPSTTNSVDDRRSSEKFGGNIGSNEVIFYLFGLPNQHNKETAMSYVEIKSRNKNDMFNIGSVENLMRGIMAQEPAKTWYKRLKIEEK